MRRLMALVVSGVLVSGCGLDLGEDETPPPPDDEAPLLIVLGVCDKSDPATCASACTTSYRPADVIDTLRPGFVDGCVEEGGRIVDVCSTQNAMGTCTVSSEGVAVDEVTIYFANGDLECDTPAENQSFCEQSGTWE